VAGQIRRGYPDVEHEQRDGDGKNAVTERLDPRRLGGPAEWGSAIDDQLNTTPFFPSKRGKLWIFQDSINGDTMLLINRLPVLVLLAEPSWSEQDAPGSEPGSADPKRARWCSKIDSR